AQKHQVQVMVRSLVGAAEVIESEDACDAIAVAICHATHQAASRRLAGGARGGGGPAARFAGWLRAPSRVSISRNHFPDQLLRSSRSPSRKPARVRIRKKLTIRIRCAFS